MDGYSSLLVRQGLRDVPSLHSWCSTTFSLLAMRMFDLVKQCAPDFHTTRASLLKRFWIHCGILAGEFPPCTATGYEPLGVQLHMHGVQHHQWLKVRPLGPKKAYNSGMSRLCVCVLCVFSRVFSCILGFCVSVGELADHLGVHRVFFGAPAGGGRLKRPGHQGDPIVGGRFPDLRSPPSQRSVTEFVGHSL